MSSSKNIRCTECPLNKPLIDLWDNDDDDRWDDEPVTEADESMS